MTVPAPCQAPSPGTRSTDPMPPTCTDEIFGIRRAAPMRCAPSGAMPGQSREFLADR
jgi:hypothetical protein